MNFPRDHLSYSSVSKYLQCPKRWHFDYVIVPEKKKEGLALGLGSVYHSAIEGLYTTGDFDNGKKLIVDFASQNGRFAQKEIEKIGVCFENYYRQIYPQYASRVERIEMKDKVEIGGVGVPLEYRIDLVTTDGVLVDHKTVGRMKPNISYSLQFDLYAYAYYRNYGTLPKRVEYHYAYKTTGGVESEGKSVKMAEVLKAVSCVQGVARGIKEDMFTPTYGKHCDFCPHKEICDREFGAI